MKKTIWQEVKEMFTWFKDMTTWRNVAITFLFFGILIGVPLLVFGMGFLSSQFYGYMTDLYSKADEGDKFNGILVIVVFFAGMIANTVASAVTKKVKNKK